MARRIKELMAQKKMVKAFGVGQLCDPKVVEMVGLLGWWDAVWLDQEHTGITIDQIGAAARGAKMAGLDCFVRVAPTDYATIMRPLEAGAYGIMAAQIRSAEQAAQVIEWAKFHPLGLRGVNSGGVDGNYGATRAPLNEYLERANDETYVIMQIEHFQAVDAIDAIAGLKSLDAVFIGPADLSQSMGIPGQWDHPDLTKAIGEVARACAKHGITWAILPFSPALAKKYVEMGCRFLSVGFDVPFVLRGARAVSEDYAWLDK